MSDDADFSAVRASIVDAERELANRFDSDGGDYLEVANDAATLLAMVMNRVGERTSSVTLDDNDIPTEGAEELILLALQLIGARALRAMRASQATLRAGYEHEAGAQDRVLLELHEHQAAILGDSSGTEALRWLRHERGRGIAKRIAALTSSDLYTNLCHDAHGDPALVERLLDVDTNTIRLQPTRSVATHVHLMTHAAFARDSAIAIAAAAGIPLSGIETLDGNIVALRDRLEADARDA